MDRLVGSCSAPCWAYCGAVEGCKYRGTGPSNISGLSLSSMYDAFTSSFLAERLSCYYSYVDVYYTCRRLSGVPVLTCTCIILCAFVSRGARCASQRWLGCESNFFLFFSFFAIGFFFFFGFFFEKGHFPFLA